MSKKPTPKKEEPKKPDLIKSLQDLKQLYSNTDVHTALDQAIELAKTQK
jgi:hypothetical protein